MLSRYSRKYARASIATAVIVGFLVCHANLPEALAQSPPQYQLTWLDESGTNWLPSWPSTTDTGVRIRDINEDGIAVGWGGPSTSFVYLPSATGPGQMRDLNELGATWFDLDDPGVPATGWRATWSASINRSGRIVGRANEHRIFVLDGVGGPSPSFRLLPSLGEDLVGNPSINEQGVVASGFRTPDGISHTAVYDPGIDDSYSTLPVIITGDSNGTFEINGFGVIAGIGSRYQPDGQGGYEIVSHPNYAFYGINELGQMAGYRRTVGSGKNKVTGGPVRFDSITGQEILLFSSGEQTYHVDVNNFGDVAFQHQGRGYIYWDASGQSVPLDSLVVNPDAIWTGRSMQMSGINDRGQMIGEMLGVPYKSFLLTPIEPDPNAPLVYNSSDTPKNIPDNKPAGITSTIAVGNVVGSTTIVNMSVALNITHLRPSDLRVYLIGPDNTSVQLFNFNGINDVTAFDGQSCEGTWTLKVSDVVKQKTGTLNGWTLTIER